MDTRVTRGADAARERAVERARAEAEELDPLWEPPARRRRRAAGASLVHFSAQLESCLPQKIPSTSPSTPRHPLTSP